MIAQQVDDFDAFQHDENDDYEQQQLQQLLLQLNLQLLHLVVSLAKGLLVGFGCLYDVQCNMDNAEQTVQ